MLCNVSSTRSTQYIKYTIALKIKAKFWSWEEKGGKKEAFIGSLKPKAKLQQKLSEDI